MTVVVVIFDIVRSKQKKKMVRWIYWKKKKKIE